MAKKFWRSSVFDVKENSVCVEFSYLSPDGENGYPGSVLFKTFYTIIKIP